MEHGWKSLSPCFIRVHPWLIPSPGVVLRASGFGCGGIPRGMRSHPSPGPRGACPGCNRAGPGCGCTRPRVRVYPASGTCVPSLGYMRTLASCGCIRAWVPPHRMVSSFEVWRFFPPERHPPPRVPDAAASARRRPLPIRNASRQRQGRCAGPNTNSRTTPPAISQTPCPSDSPRRGRRRGGRAVRPCRGR